MKVSIVIATHNEGELLIRTISSCVESVNDLDYEIIVADDASTDGSPAKAENLFAPVKVCRHAARRGVSATRRTGAEMARGDILLFLDGHCKPARGSLEAFARTVTATNGQAIISPRVPALDVGNWQYNLAQAGHGYGLDLLTFDSYWVGLEKLKKSTVGDGKLYESPALIGCAFAIDRVLYDKLWGFDENMSFWGVEDIDFGLKCWLMGYSVLHDPDIIIGHRFQQSFSTYSVPAEHILVNQLRMAFKAFSHGAWNEWVAAARLRNSRGLPDHPEGIWARAWELFKAGEASAKQERAYLHANRPRDEFWYAKRFGLGFPLLSGAQAQGRAALMPHVGSPAPSRSPLPSGSPHPSQMPSAAPPKISSQAVATVPANRGRTLIGVGEQVRLTFSNASANWAVGGGGGITPASGKTVLFTASDVASTSTVTATDRTSGAKTTLRFTVIAPSGVTDQRAPNTPIFHTQDRPDSGLMTNIYITPATVSFQFISMLELEVPAVATGVYAPLNGTGHGPSAVPVTVGPVVPGLGSKVNAVDTVYSGDPGTAAPFAPGSITFNIPYQYKLQSGGPFHNFATVTQQCALAADAQTLTSAKAGAGISIHVSDPTTSTPHFGEAGTRTVRNVKSAKDNQNVTS